MKNNKQIGGQHYKDMKIQPIDFIYENNIPFIEGAVIKYVCRHRQKNGAEDIQKAIHFLEMLLDREYMSYLCSFDRNSEEHLETLVCQDRVEPIIANHCPKCCKESSKCKCDISEFHP